MQYFMKKKQFYQQLKILDPVEYNRVVSTKKYKNILSRAYLQNQIPKNIQIDESQPD